MRKLIVFIAVWILAAPAKAEHNPFFGDNQNKISVGISQGMSTGWLFPTWRDEFVPFAQLHMAYAVPNTFFHLPGRQSINVSAMLGWGTSTDYRHEHPTKGGPPIYWDWGDIAHTAQIIYYQQDVALFSGKDWYTGIGAGIGMQRHENDRIDTKLMFSFRMFAGYAITENWRGEIFFQHFSNGSTHEANFSYNSIGFGLGYAF